MAGKKSRAVSKSASSPVLIVVVLVIIAAAALYLFDTLSQPGAEATAGGNSADAPDAAASARIEGIFIGIKEGVAVMEVDGEQILLEHKIEAPIQVFRYNEDGTIDALDVSSIPPRSLVSVFQTNEFGRPSISLIIVRGRAPEPQPEREPELPVI